MSNGRIWLSLWLVAGGTTAVQAADWVTAPSYFTHNPQTGQRVRQFAPTKPVYAAPRGDFLRSGYRNTRSSIQVGGAADHYHLVEEWGREVRPYGEWRFPYRPYSVPYPLWGPPVAFGVAPFPFAGIGRRGLVGPAADPRRGRGGPFEANPGYQPQPWDDGRYPPYDADGPYGYPDLRRRAVPRPDGPTDASAPRSW